MENMCHCVIWEIKVVVNATFPGIIYDLWIHVMRKLNLMFGIWFPREQTN